jgi:hypothetical protein
VSCKPRPAIVRLPHPPVLTSQVNNLIVFLFAKRRPFRPSTFNSKYKLQEGNWSTSTYKYLEWTCMYVYLHTYLIYTTVKFTNFAQSQCNRTEAPAFVHRTHLEHMWWRCSYARTYIRTNVTKLYLHNITVKRNNVFEQNWRVQPLLACSYIGASAFNNSRWRGEPLGSKIYPLRAS